MLRRCLTAAACLSIATAAAAQDGQTYLYDAQGRLSAVTTARTSGTSTVTDYFYDAADNRRSTGSYPTSPPPTPYTLAFPYTLVPTQRIVSPNGQYSLGLEQSGDLVLRDAGGASVWRSCTDQGRSWFARVSPEGLLTVYGPTGVTLWTAGGAGSPGAELTVQDSGVAALKTTGGLTLWTSSTPCA